MGRTVGKSKGRLWREMMCHSNDYLVVEGNQYPAGTTLVSDIIEAERQQDREPLIIVETAGSIVVVAEQDFNPNLAHIIKNHLAGRWVVFMDADDRLQGRNIGPDLEQRLEKVLAILPIRWGEQPDKCELLGITQRELQWALAELAKRGLAHRPQQGTWVKTPLAGEKVEE
jgi:hypothetical protein